jgi:lipopolysaccharide/colanic/teichoic acid biosynthesis glycosyltransferase
LSKRAFDFVAALLGMTCLSPLFLVIAVLIQLDSRGPVIFKQERIGRGLRPFFIYKFRTMVKDAFTLGSVITVGEDPRITRVGHFLRRTKLDELPQLLNVLKGDMSIVGPRPEVRRYVEAYRQDYEEVLKVRPGMTDLASLKFRDEAAILGTFDDPEDVYLKRILPEKVKLGKAYARGSSLCFDIAVIVRTLTALAARRVSS